MTTADQMNMRGVFLHVLADALGSVIVIASATVSSFKKAVLSTIWNGATWHNPLIAPLYYHYFVTMIVHFDFSFFIFYTLHFLRQIFFASFEFATRICFTFLQQHWKSGEVYQLSIHLARSCYKRGTLRNITKVVEVLQLYIAWNCSFSLTSVELSNDDFLPLFLFWVLLRSPTSCHTIFFPQKLLV